MTPAVTLALVACALGVVVVRRRPAAVALVAVQSLILAALAFPMTYFAHRGLTRFVLSGRSGGDITQVVEEHFGIKAGALVKVAAGVLGGGGGGKDDIAQGGGTDPAKAPEALSAIEAAVAGAAG